MNRLLRITFISAGIAGALLVLFLLLDTSIISTYLLNTINESISTPAVRVTGEGLSLLFLGVSIETIRVLLTKFFIALTIQTASLNCLSPSLFIGNPRCSISGKMYSGSFDAVADISSSSMLISRAALHGVTLSQHPHLQLLGISGGIIEATAENISTPITRSSTGTAEIHIKDLSLTRQLTIPAKLSGLPLPLTIPEITVRSATARLAGTQKVTDIEIISSFGEVRGEVQLSQDPILSLNLSLSQHGLANLRPYLQFICSPHVLDSEGSIHIRGSIRRPSCN